LLLSARRSAAALLLAGVRRPPLSIDLSWTHGAQQQTRSAPQLRSHGGTKEVIYSMLERV